MASNKKGEERELWGFIIFVVVMAIGLPSMAGLILGGFEIDEYMTKMMFYYGFAFGGAFGLMALRKLEIAKTKSPISNAIIHDPETDGALLKLDKKLMNWFKNPFRVFMLSFIAFGFYGIWGSVTNTFFIGIPQVTMQVTEASRLIFAAEPAAIAETVFFIFIISILLGTFNYLRHRYKWSNAVFWTLSLVIIPLSIAFLWMGYHTLRYSTAETALVGTFVFGYLGTMITLLTGTFIIWYVWHFQNNLFVQMNKLFSDEKIIIIAIVLLGIVAAVWGLVEWRAKASKPRKATWLTTAITYMIYLPR